MTRRREPAHLQADLRQDDLRHAAVDSGDRCDPIDQLFGRAQGLGDPVVVATDQALQVPQMVHQRPKEEAVVFRHGALQRHPQLRDLAPQAPPRPLRQLDRIELTPDDRLDHIPARDAQHVRGDRAEFDVGVLQHLLDPVGDGGLLADQLGALAGQVPQLPGRSGWDEAGPQQAMLEELGDPLAVLDVGLATGDLFDVMGVDQDDREPRLQEVKLVFYSNTVTTFAAMTYVNFLD